ncbi:MAG TPA: hypothetical protein VI757_07635 [Bacteroidia bacterium]|nr:hypothetical protein [Bacteroidia bacterium]
MNRKYFSFALFIIASALLIFNGCSKEDPAPENPFGPQVIVHDTDTTTTVIPDPYSITGLHKNIFSTRCNVPGCHDGTFEPDFRTIQSSYSTLVYQRVNKVTVNNVDSFTFRVIPFDTTNSFIHERLTTTTPDYMPSNGNRLSQAEINQINTWIMNGAKDINGNIPVAPNNLPNLIPDSGYYWAFDSLTFVPLYGNMISTSRYQGVSYYPFLVGANRTMKIIFWVQDDSTALGNLQVNQCKLSLIENDFSAAQTVTATFINFGAPLQFWMVTFPVTWTVGTQVYFRYYVRDADNPATVEFPRNDMPFYYKSYFSFLVQ